MTTNNFMRLGRALLAARYGLYLCLGLTITYPPNRMPFIFAVVIILSHWLQKHLTRNYMAQQKRTYIGGNYGR